MIEGREKDIQELCKQVLADCLPNMDYTTGTASCPFCGNETFGNEMKEIKHADNCAYLIAINLATKTTLTCYL